MGLRLTINNALAFSLSLLFLSLVVCAVVFVVNLIRAVLEKRAGQSAAKMAACVGAAIVIIASAPLARPVISMLANWSAGETSITTAKFNAIKPGMGYEQIKQLMGSDGVEFTRTEQSNFIVSTYQWDNPDGSYVQVTLNNNAVNNKMQYGLSR